MGRYKALGQGGNGAILVYDHHLQNSSELIGSALPADVELVVKVGYSYSDQGIESTGWCFPSEQPILELADQLREAQLLARLTLVKHPHILPLVGLVRVPELFIKYYDTNLVTGLGLVLPRGQYPLSKVTGSVPCMLKQLARVFLSLEYLHGQGYCHLDVKETNILLSKDVTHTWLIDFGAAAHSSETATILLGGPVQYRAPEIRDGTGWSSAADVWSAAMVMLSVFAHWHTCSGGTWTDQLPTMRTALGATVDELLTGMLALVPNERWTMTQVLDHPVFDPVRTVIDDTRALAIPSMAAPLVVVDIPNLTAHSEWPAVQAVIQADYCSEDSPIFGQVLALMDRYLPYYNPRAQPLLQLYYTARVMMHSYHGRKSALTRAIDKSLGRSIAYDIVEQLPLHQLTVAPIPEARVREWLALD